LNHYVYPDTGISSNV